jgi:hypothetical protein
MMDAWDLREPGVRPGFRPAGAGVRDAAGCVRVLVVAPGVPRAGVVGRTARSVRHERSPEHSGLAEIAASPTMATDSRKDLDAIPRENP